MPLVSIIIPVFNGERTIERSVGCSLRQTIQDIQIVVVDDGSTDRTVEIAAEFASQDERVVLVKHEQNKGRLEARRSGVNAAKAPFVLFLDADDELLPDAVEQALAVQGGHYDIVQFGVDTQYADYVSGEKKKNFDRQLQPPATTKSAGEITHLFFRDRKSSWSLWGKLFRADQLKQAFGYVPQQPMQRAEDACIFFILSCIASSYKGVPSYKGYVYHVSEGGTAAGTENLRLSDFEQNCNMVHAMDCIAHYVEENQLQGEFQADYEVTRKEHCLAIAEDLLWRVNAQDKPDAFSFFLRTWPADEAVAALANAGWYEAGQTYCTLASSKALQAPACEIKTVGIYHSTMGFGGAERVTAWLAQLWATMGYQLVLFTDDTPTDCVFDLPESIVRVQLPRSFSVRPQTYMQRANLIAEAVVEHKIDALIYHQWWNPLLAWDMLLIKALGLPFALFNHAPYKVFFSEALPWELDASRLLRHTDGLVVLSESDKHFWQHWVPRVWQTPNPPTVFPENTKRSALDSQEILWVGRLSGFDKQPIEALEIFARVAKRNPAAHLTLVGGGNQASELIRLQRHARKLGIESKVEFAGGQKDVEPFYLRASALLVTSSSESWCLVLAEGMAYGLPSVMYDLPHLTLLQNNSSVATVPQGNRDAAAQALLELLDNPDVRKQRGQEAFDYSSAVASFDFKVFWANIFKTLEQGSPERVGFEQADDEWDTIISGFQSSIAKATDLRVLSYGKRKVLKAARAVNRFIQK